MFIKIALDDLSPVALVLGRTALGAFVLLPVALARGALVPARRHLGTLALVAAVQIAGPFLLIAAGETKISSSLAGILVASAPIWTSLLAVAFVPSERLQGTGLIGIAVGIVGVVLLFGLDLEGGDALLGGAMILLAALGYAVGALVAKRRLTEVPAVGLVASIMSLSALMVLPFALFSLPAQAPGLDTIGAMIALGAGGTGARLPHLLRAQHRTGPRPRVGRRLRRPGVLGRLWRRAARRGLHGGHRGRAGADPGRVV